MTRLMAFSGANLDHCDTERDPDTIKAAMREPEARAILFSDYNPAVEPDGSLMEAHPSVLADVAMFDPAIIFLGREADTRRPWFAAHVQDAGDRFPPETFADMRRMAGGMDARDLAITGRARSLLDWHGGNQFCSRCGTKSGTSRGGALRVCPNCNAEHYPRVNPVAIMLVERDDHLLLGRQAFWPEGSFSALAGFVSPGEDLEEACAREVKEEVGLDVTGVRYLMSQAWPFPSQLMLGLVCEAAPGELTIDTTELETAQWFSRAEVQAVWSKTGEAFRRPPAFTIAHQLIRAWLQDVKPGIGIPEM